MAELAWPDDLGHGTFVGRFGFMDADGHDPDREPDITSATGGSVTITPSIRSVRYTGAAGPMILAARAAKGVIDGLGYLRTMDANGRPGDTGMVFPATDDTDLSPTDWTYEVSIILDGSVRLPTFNVKLPEGSTVDLSLAVPVSSSGGTAVVVDPTTATRAESAATRAETAAAEAEGWAPAFDWDGTRLVIDGEPGPDLKGEGASWSELTDVPATFPPEAHPHVVTDVDGLADRLAALEADTGWLELVYDPAVAERVGTERAQIRLVGNVVELAMSVRTSATWTTGVTLAQLPAGIPSPRVAYRPPSVYGNASIPVVIGTDVRLYAPAQAGTVYRISDTWTV